MASTPPPPGPYRSRANPATVVELVAAGVEYRIAEMRSKCCIYTRNGRFFVRAQGEFFAKFEPHAISAQTLLRIAAEKAT